MLIEKRKNKRFKVSQFLSIAWGKEEFVAVSAKDISLGGIRCVASVPVDPLTQVYLMVTIPLKEGEHIIKSEGVVVHTEKIGNEYQMGVKFLDLLESDRKILKEYLDNLEDEQ